ncbi:hypothetical protein EC973_004755 [Apophysomyces ossiformis]|uniref:Xylanolytic transcriptional activator regulatory domain-containing protein n=1 Tax=Apophysomyces ossiformis TaxID=679940 RepID=A0A8H7BX76_9FUNG|nr:hypothetical protein EC973_004755 [Apophysomyces ossiformis]
MLLVDMGGTAKRTASGKKSALNKKNKQPAAVAEAKAAAKEQKTQQDELEALQITFYEIESWIEKTTPILGRMTKELDKASHHFDKRRKEIRQQDSPGQSSRPLMQPLSWDRDVSKSKVDQLNAMQWSLSFQPGNSLRLETNIKSVDQLVDAVKKIRLLADPAETADLIDTNLDDNDNDSIVLCSSSSTPSGLLTMTPDPDPATEYWNIALLRRPHICLEKFKHCEMNLSRLTKDVSPDILNRSCQILWDCLHPKFSGDWSSFWDRSGDAKRNQVCIDSGLAMVFLHVLRHHKNICENAHDIACYYYDRAREALMEFFDAPDCATIETLMNLSMFCILCKRHSQARIYIGLGLRMMLEMGMHKRSKLPQARVLRKKYLKLFMVLYYNDITCSMYSGEPALLDDKDMDIDFYEIIDITREAIEVGEIPRDEKAVAKDTYFAHLLELARIGKRTKRLIQDYKQQTNLPRGGLTPRWAKQVQQIEIALATWFDRLPDYYRVDPQPDDTSMEKPHQHNPQCDAECTQPMDAEALREQSALLLMLQYQAQWIILYKAFLPSPANSSPFTPSLGSPASSARHSQRSDSPASPRSPSSFGDQSQAICTDAANRIVILAERITTHFGWCVCQHYVNCIYQASTIYCRNVLNKDEQSRQAAKAMIRRIIRILASGCERYQGFPEDLTACLNEFLANHGMQDHPMEEMDNTNEQGEYSLLKRYFTTPSYTLQVPHSIHGFNDTLPNSPHMYRQTLSQQQVRSPLAGSQSPAKAAWPVKIEEPDIEGDMSMDMDMKNWR